MADKQSEADKDAMSPLKYRKKPVVIEAMQFDGSLKPAREIIRWANAELEDCDDP